MTKKLLCFFLAVVMLLSASMTAFAENNNPMFTPVEENSTDLTVTKGNQTANIYVKFAYDTFSLTRPGDCFAYTVDKSGRRIEGKKIISGIFKLTVPAGEDNTYRIEAGCKKNGYAVQKTYQKVTVRAKKNVEVHFVVGKAAPIVVYSTFMDGAHLAAPSYTIKGTFNDEESGFISDEQWCPIVGTASFYTVSPKNVPEGYTVKPSTQTLKYDEGTKQFLPVTFLYEKITGSLKIRTVLEDGTNLEDIETNVTRNGQPVQDLDKMDLGEYQVTVTYDEEKYELIGEAIQTVTLTPDDKDQTVTFTFKENSAMKGSLMIVTQDEDGHVIVDADPIYKVTKDGELISEFNNMDLGVYEVTLESFNKEKYKLIGEATQTVTLTPDDKDKTVEFTFRKKAEAPQDAAEITVKVESTLSSGFVPEDGISVFAKSDSGEEIPAEKKHVKTYILKVPMPKDEMTVRVEVDCTASAYAMVETYQTVTVGKGEKKTLTFKVGSAAKELEIRSVFKDGASYDVKYRAVSAGDDKTKGSIHTDMKHLYILGEYTVSPIQVPEGYTVEPKSQKTSKISHNQFEPMTFTYTPTTLPEVKGSLTMKVVDSETAAAITDATPVYEVKKDGAVVEETTELELGEYSVTLKSVDAAYEIVSESTKTVELTKEKPNAEVSLSSSRCGEAWPDRRSRSRRERFRSRRSADRHRGRSHRSSSRNRSRRDRDLLSGPASPPREDLQVRHRDGRHA